MDDEYESQPFKGFDEKDIKFIKPWFQKWKNQTIYQVLLLYRAAQQRNLVYFCQQVHLYNQNNRSMLESISGDVQLEELDLEADPKEIFPDVNVAIQKIPFKLGDLAFCDNSHLCQPLYTDREVPATDLEEEWDSPLKPFIPKVIPEIPEVKAPEMEDKEIQTDELVNNDMNRNNVENENKGEGCQCTQKENSLSTNINNNIKLNDNNNNHEDKNNNMEESDNLKPVSVNNKYSEIKENGNLEKTAELTSVNGLMNQKDTGNFTDEDPKPNHTEFVKEQNEFRKPPKYIGVGLKRNIKPRDEIDKFNDFDVNDGTKDKPEWTQRLPKFKNPIKELEEKFKAAETSKDSDEPPYNFRAMLRKTNFTDPSYKRSTERTINSYDFTQRPKLRKVPEPKMEKELVQTEIAPGLIMEGEIADL